MKHVINLEIAFTVDLSKTDIEDLEKWSRQFSESVSEFGENLRKFISEQPIIQGCTMTQNITQ